MEDVEHPQIQHKPFSIQTDVYSGPLDLLINLIEKRKLLINDISLAAVTDEYIRYVALLEQNPLRETAEFVVLASTLLLIKSKSLLPILDLTDEEEESVDDLQKRLKHYQIYRNAARCIEEIFGKTVLHERRYLPHREPLFVTDRFTEYAELTNALSEVIARLPQKITKPRVRVQRIVSLEEMIERLKDRVERQLSFKFTEFAGGERERTTIIVGFLALLEMVKQGSINAHQTTRYTDIEIEREGTGTPRYS